MLRTLERYQKCNYGAPEPNVPSREALAVVPNSLLFLLITLINYSQFLL